MICLLNIHVYLVWLQLCDLYENDCIFDKFDCCLSGDGQHVATGSYSNLYRVFGCMNGSDVVLESSRDPLRRRLQTPQRVRRLLSYLFLQACAVVDWGSYTVDSVDCPCQLLCALTDVLHPMHHIQNASRFGLAGRRTGTVAGRRGQSLHVRLHVLYHFC